MKKLASRLVREPLDRHGTGRVLFRNTRAAVQGFPQRELHAYPSADAEPVRGMPAGEHPDLYPEVNFQQQWEDGDDNNRWWRFDPRVEWLIDTLKMLKQFKVLVICAHAETAPRPGRRPAPAFGHLPPRCSTKA
ncbi:hypothetical protein ACPA9J_31735 [Pseudomonas aeruginosa]